ncbi:Nucleotide-binding universal stress protein, UspA family [Lentzea fradiae]|uniref:Nucleotide-binding universal stress protein, UspA family n=1 Tax=Lentzea fradiae TaxID=200378 RepID=A0A1G7KW49_9PSEU|nr:universal stress protein [Lentzea fradiae]SDF41341.1 Nucleotide-binding universal stress protein, UspA family [Lentzea fradiae]
MTEPTVAKPIVVGVDGSTSALDATRWAAAEAARRSTGLVLLHSYPPVPFRGPRRGGSTAEFGNAVRDQGRQWLDATAAVAREAAPGVEVTTELVEGGAAEQLVGRSATAELVVLGSRGLGGFTGLLVGSIAVAVSTHALCPVVVVREGQAPAQDAPVVVGVDGSVTSEAALEFAFQVAELRGAPLLAVRTWSDSLVDATKRTVQVAAAVEEIEAEERQLLEEEVGACAKNHPGVTVRQELVRGGAVRVLTEQSASAQLVVVGTRGRGGFRGLLLGSTSQSLIYNAQGPVAVVPPAHQ